jgi:pilus assembly protein CpaC
MDLPILGQLFRSESFKRDETELVVIVTTSLARAAPANALVAATDSLAPASDSDTWVYGKLLRRFSPGFLQDSAAPRPVPGVGFMLDGISPG